MSINDIKDKISINDWSKSVYEGGKERNYIHNIRYSNIRTSIKKVNIPEQYKEYGDTFEKKNADMLSQHRPYDCSIDLQEGAQSPFGPIYSLSQNELVALREYLDENLVKNFIR